MGDPGAGKREVRAGAEFLFDRENLVMRYGLEEVKSCCIGTPREQKAFHWKVDKYFPRNLRVSAKTIPKRDDGWHFGHLLCYSYHNFDEDEKETVSSSSVGFLQPSVVNQGAWSQLEVSFKFLSLKYRTFVWTGTTLR